MTNLKYLEDKLTELKGQGLFNTIPVIESEQGAWIVVNGKKVLNLCSNNYLGLANHPRLKASAKDAIDKYGVGPGAVRTIAGTNTLHITLEKNLAEFKKAEAVITFPGGFSANLAVIPAIVNEGDVIFSDELNHASIIDGCRLTKAQVIRFEHANPKDLETKLKETKAEKKLVITDGVFSMDGDIAPLPELTEIAHKYGALIMVDDAHGEGVLGSNGRGIVDHFNLHGKVDIEVGTLSKAFGVIGGFAAGSKTLVDWLSQRARPFLFSSAMTPADTGAAIEAVKILSESDTLVQKLWDNAKYLQEKLKNLGFDTGNSQTPIIPVMLGEAKLAQEFSKLLFENGVFAKAIGYPTVPQGKARIRVMNSAAHETKDLDFAAEVFKKVKTDLKI